MLENVWNRSDGCLVSGRLAKGENISNRDQTWFNFCLSNKVLHKHALAYCHFPNFPIFSHYQF